MDNGAAGHSVVQGIGISWNLVEENPLENSPGAESWSTPEAMATPNFYTGAEVDPPAAWQEPGSHLVAEALSSVIRRLR